MRMFVTLYAMLRKCSEARKCEDPALRHSCDTGRSHHSTSTLHSLPGYPQYKFPCLLVTYSPCVGRFMLSYVSERIWCKKERNSTSGYAKINTCMPVVVAWLLLPEKSEYRFHTVTILFYTMKKLTSQ